MTRPSSAARLALCAALGLAACRATSAPSGPPVALTYVGSSTVGHFVRDADALYAPARFTLDTAPESAGGEEALIAGLADLGGVAREPRPEVAAAGVRATLIGRDALAVITHPALGVRDLSRAQLAQLFGGEVVSWSALGGPETAARPMVVAPESATHGVFRAAVLGGAPYAERCEVVRPDAEIVTRVADTPGAVGVISLSFLDPTSPVQVVAVDGVLPGRDHFDYPLTRPLYLLWQPGLADVEDFVDWAVSAAGQRVVMQRFVGTGVVAAVGATPPRAPKGVLVVRTPREEVYDGGIWYHPHRAYELRTRAGKLLRVVPNRVGNNDERPMRVDLDPGTYLVRAPAPRGRRIEVLATVESGRTTELDIVALAGAQR